MQEEISFQQNLDLLSQTIGWSQGPQDPSCGAFLLWIEKSIYNCCPWICKKHVPRMYNWLWNDEGVSLGMFVSVSSAVKSSGELDAPALRTGACNEFGTWRCRVRFSNTIISCRSFELKKLISLSQIAILWRKSIEHNGWIVVGHYSPAKLFTGHLFLRDIQRVCFVFSVLIWCNFSSSQRLCAWMFGASPFWAHDLVICPISFFLCWVNENFALCCLWKNWKITLPHSHQTTGAVQ